MGEQRKRAAESVRYWIQHNTFGMGAHDLAILEECVAALEGGPEEPNRGIVHPPRDVLSQHLDRCLVCGHSGFHSLTCELNPDGSPNRVV